MGKPFLFTFVPFVFLWGYKESIMYLILLVFSIGIVFLFQSFKQKQKEKEAERIRTLLKSIRHDWMNHVQVIMGYQMLKQYDKVDQYLQKLTQRSSEERMISELTYPLLATQLLTLPYEYPQWNWKVKLDDSIVSLSSQHQKRFYQLVNQLLPWITDKIATQITWTEIEFDLSYEQKQCIFVFRLIGKESDVPTDHQPMEWGELPKKLRRSKASYQWSEDGHALFVYIPFREIA